MIPVIDALISRTVVAVMMVVPVLRPQAERRSERANQQ
jgi:hypothetical protein